MRETQSGRRPQPSLRVLESDFPATQPARSATSPCPLNWSDLATGAMQVIDDQSLQSLPVQALGLTA